MPTHELETLLDLLNNKEQNQSVERQIRNIDEFLLKGLLMKNKPLEYVNTDGIILKIRRGAKGLTISFLIGMNSEKLWSFKTPPSNDETKLQKFVLLLLTLFRRKLLIREMPLKITYNIGNSKQQAKKTFKIGNEYDPLLWVVSLDVKENSSYDQLISEIRKLLKKNEMTIFKSLP